MERQDGNTLTTEDENVMNIILLLKQSMARDLVETEISKAEIPSFLVDPNFLMSTLPVMTTLCPICYVSPPKYRCPRCFMQTCSLASTEGRAPILKVATLL